jgi:hypothetical protein
MNKFYWMIAFVASSIIYHILDNKLRTVAQNNKNLYGIIMASDLCTFAINGGDQFGYNNYFKWHYAKWINDPKRTTFERMMFWRVGIIYDATDPPDEYEFPSKK